MTAAFHMVGARPRGTVATAQSSTVLLMHCDGTDGSTAFVDSSPYAHTFTNNSAALDTAQKKFGTTSLLIASASSAYLTVNNAGAEMVLGTNDFTLECWWRAGSATVSTLIEMRAGTGGNQPCLGMNNVGRVTAINNGTTRTGTTQYSTGAWVHMAMCRKDGTTRVFANGTQQISFADTTNYASAGVGRPRFGRDAGAANGLNGWLDEIRILNGFGAYDAAFTPPAAPFT